MKRKLFLFIMAAGCITFIIACNPSPSKDTATATNPEPVKVTIPPPEVPDAADQFQTAMRKLWEDHVTWTRNVIFCLVDNLPGSDQAVQRLLKNQDDIGDAVKPYYGDEAGAKLTNLLRDHIMISADVVKAAKMNNKAALDKANKTWTDNADAISALLSGANPNWPLDDLKMMMHDHLKLTTDEAVARIKKDYDGDIKAYDHVHDEILKMADMLSFGIIKQFPDKFK